MNLTVLDYSRLIISLLMLSTGIGLIFIALSTARRTAINYYFTVFATVLSAFALTLLLRTITGGMPNSSLLVVLRLLTILPILLISSFFSFVVYFLSRKATLVLDDDTGRITNSQDSVREPNESFGKNEIWVKWMMWALWIISFSAIGLSVIGNLFAEVSADGRDFRLNILGNSLIGIAIIYGVAAVVLVWRSEKDRAKWLRLPSVCIILGYIMTAIAPDFPFDIMLFTVAAVWSASALMRQQIFMPIQRLNQELAKKNEAYQETVSQLHDEKKRVETLNRELMASNRYRAEFMANVSHELRTPLNAVIGYSELLVSPIYGTLNTQQTDRLQRIHRSGKHLLQLVDTVLDMGRIESGKLILEPSNFNVYAVIETVFARTQAHLIEKSLTFEQHIPPDLPTLYADISRVEQILYNLVDNAIKFTDVGAVNLQALTLTVQDGIAQEYELPSRNWLRDGQWLLFEVQDTGIGIAEKDLARIFVKFTQLDGSNIREVGGLGLGLAMVKQLVELHAGMIWVHSLVNRGSTFYVALPIEAQPFLIK